ncbi:IS4 family transposase [Virgibacillus byunsanensis]|uniref:IS4 family transposase n=1 Tax=Virgibacillus byunsanensis TaxID=570945 RepID=A0ABW3LQP3_9BACI
MKKYKFLEAIEVSRNVLYDFGFMCDSRTKSTYFTREGGNKLTFDGVILFVLNLVTKSLQIELDNFFELIKKKGTSISKQGFSQARKKIKPEAFEKLFDTNVSWFYKSNNCQRFMGFRLLAIDASIMEIVNSQKLRDTFGASKGNGKEHARAMVSTIYDTENDLFVKGLITKFASCERAVAKQLIDSYAEIRLDNDLFLFDRGYPSKDFFLYLLKMKVNFIARTQVNYYKSSIKEGVQDQMFELIEKGEIMHLRAIRFTLSSGKEELLITNVANSALGLEEFKQLYFKRWAIETKYDVLKNKIHIEKFAGASQQTIKQEFFGALFLTNMASIIKRESDELIVEDQREKNLKYEYQTNNNILIGKLKDKIVCFMLEPRPRRRRKMYKQLLEEVQRNRTPIRPGRSFKRSKRLSANKSDFSQRSAL